MRVLGVVLLAVLMVLPVVGGTARGESAIPIDLGGGLVGGGYFGELRHDWRSGFGGTLFVQVPMKHDLEARLLGSMLWNDGSRAERTPDDDDPDLGAAPGDRPHTLRRTSFEVSLLWRVEPLALGNVGVPYVGVGLSVHEIVPRYDGPAGEREATIWDQGLHALVGVRLYRTSGLFLATEAKAHAVNTPDHWSYAYDGALLLGILLGS